MSVTLCMSIENLFNFQWLFDLSVFQECCEGSQPSPENSQASGSQVNITLKNGQFCWAVSPFKGTASCGLAMINAKQNKTTTWFVPQGAQFVSSALNLLILCTITSIFTFNMFVLLNKLQTFHQKVDIVCVLGSELRNTKHTNKHTLS